MSAAGPSAMPEERRLRTTVTALGSRGEGIVEGPADRPFYLPFAAPGDEVEIAWRADRKGRLTVRSWRLIRPSARRQQPICRHFGHCGGCMLQHVNPETYADWLDARIRRALNTQGLAHFADRIAAPTVSPPGSRRRLVLHAAAERGRPVLGLHARRSHTIVDLTECPVARPRLWATLQTLRPHLARLTQGGPITITGTETAAGIDILLSGRAEPNDPDLLADLAAWCAEADVAALSWSDGGRPQRLVERREPVVSFAGIPVPFPSGAFLQATEEGQAALQRAVRDWTPAGSRLLDLFAGLGALSLPMVQHSRRIMAVEGDSLAVTALRQAATAAGITERYATSHRDLFRSPLGVRALSACDVAVIDPPRAGAKDQMRAIAASPLSRVILISCNPNTWARDVRILADAGFRLCEIRPVAQFLWSDAVEIASLLTREDGVGR